MEGAIAHSINWIITQLILVTELCGALVILLGVGRVLRHYIRLSFNQEIREITLLRLHLGQNMVMALELQVAADILKTALDPSWEELLALIAIIAIRTLLNYLLEKEIDLLCKQELPPDLDKGVPAPKCY